MEYRFSRQHRHAFIRKMVLFFLVPNIIVTLAVLLTRNGKQQNVAETVIPLIGVYCITGTIVWWQVSARLKAMYSHNMVVSDGKVHFPDGAMTLDFDLAKVKQAIIHRRQGILKKIELNTGEKEGICLEGYERMEELTREILSIIPSERQLFKEK